MRKMALFAVTMLMAGTAVAGRCPAEWKKVDDAMAKNPTLSAAQMGDVKKARAEGETLHKSGKHSESLAEIDKAKKILKVT